MLLLFKAFFLFICLLYIELLIYFDRRHISAYRLNIKCNDCSREPSSTGMSSRAHPKSRYWLNVQSRSAGGMAFSLIDSSTSGGHSCSRRSISGIDLKCQNQIKEKSSNCRFVWRILGVGDAGQRFGLVQIANVFDPLVYSLVLFRRAFHAFRHLHTTGS